MASPTDSHDVGGHAGDHLTEEEGVYDSTETGISGIGSSARSLGQTGEVLSRKNRLQVFGIDCTGPFGDGILFKGGEWAPGGEYVQRLRVKNVSTKLKKLKYRLPTSKFFSMVYPEVITLSPGTTQEVDVVFRPMSSEVYDDVILFKILDGPNAGGFNVPVRALLPTLQVGVPVGLDFGYCQADDVSERVFFVQNTGEVPAPFQWTVPPPFKMSPAEGVVAVGESQAVTCSVRPTDASVFVSQAALKVGQGVNAIKPRPLLDMKISAVGKYCYVVPSEDELDFGDRTIVAIGGGSGGNSRAGCPRKELTLRNQSVVPAAFTINRLEEDRDAVFSVYPSEGVIPPEDEIVITATYWPVSAGTFSRDHYEIVTVGGNKVTVGIQGRAVGCSVRLEKKEDPFARGCGVPNSVNFREVKVGVTTTRVVNLYNEASTPCGFCFVIQGDSSVFRFSHTRGIIPFAGTEHPGETQVTMTFTPTKPTNYYRRIFCLLENQQPLVLDAMGTAYIVAKGEVQEQRPAPLRHAHVQAFKNRENVGLGRCSPEELDDLLATEGMSDLFAKVGPHGTLPLQRCSVSRPLTRSGEATRVQAAVAAEFFVDPTDAFVNGVYLDRCNVEFGFVSARRHETATLVNNTNTAVHVVWNIRASGEGAGEGGGGGCGEMGTTGLQVTPLEADVPAGASLAFRVEVSPTTSNCYFAEEAEAFVSPSNQMTFRMVKDATQQPPWCLALRVVGHTFVGEQFLAKVSLSTQHTGQKLCFPACHVGDTVYQTIRLSNQGNIPACYRFKPDPAGVFDIKPAVGLVPAGDFQLCLVRFTPPGPGGCHHRLECVLNNDPGSTQKVNLFGQGAWPAIEATCGGWEAAAASAADDRSRSSSTTGSAPNDRSDRNGMSVLYMRPTCVGIVSTGVVKVKNVSRIPAIFKMEPPKGSSGVLRVSPLAGLLLGNQTATIQVAFAPREIKGYRFRLPVHVRSILGETPFLTDCRQLGEAMPTAFAPGACVTVLGQGERGAVAFHPESLAFSVRLVNTPESKSLVLENCSECDVTYKLFYIANTEPPLRHSSKVSISSSDSSIAGSEGASGGGADRELRPVPKENGEAKGQGGPNTHAFFVDRPEGTLPARSRTRTIATFRPVSEGDYDYAILCQVSVGKARDGSEPSPLETDMAEQGRKARASAARLEEAGAVEPSEGAGGDGVGGTLGSMMPLRCGVSGRASFPTVVFRDVRMTAAAGRDVRGASPRNLWSALSLSRINDMLSKPLTEEEVIFNQESSPDTSQLPRFAVPFTPTVIGAGPATITLQVSNPGFLSTSLTVKLPNAKPVEMETWANEGEPTAEELRQNEIIDRLKVFSLKPDPGTVIEVAAGESRPLAISYSADSLSYEGVHDLPVLVSIKEGRHFWLDLKGITVPPQHPMLFVPTGLRRHYTLEPVAVGTPLNEAPLQTTELLNVGEAPVSFTVDAHGIKRANHSQGHGMPVFRLEEKGGTIPGGGSAFLRWRFLPLEAKEYVLRVTVRTMENLDERLGEHFGERQIEGQSVEVTLTGVGYDPRTSDPHTEALPAVGLGLVHPVRQLELPPGQPCVLGAERIRLGRIPQGAVLSRVFSLRNCLPTSAVEFSWNPQDTGEDNPLLASGVMSIQPATGKIGAAQSALFRVIISAECGPRFLGQQPVACLVRQEPRTTAARSRKPKSRLESRMEEERLARTRAREPRVPVVSRPTAARTQHMAEIAKTLSMRSSGSSCNCDNGGRVLRPAYPTSTVNAPVPRVLEEALLLGEGGAGAGGRGDNNGNGTGAGAAWELEGNGRGSRNQHSRESSRGIIPSGGGAAAGLDPSAVRPRSNGADAGAGVERAGTPLVAQGVGNTLSLANSASGVTTDRFSSRGGSRPGTAQGGGFIVRMHVEGEVVCTETFYALSARRARQPHQGFKPRSGDRAGFGTGTDTGVGKGRVSSSTGGAGNYGRYSSSSSSSSNGGPGAGSMDTFFVPRPSRYVPDWAAFGFGGGDGSGEIRRKNGDVWAEQDENLAVGEVRQQKPQREQRRQQQQQLMLLKKATLAKPVLSLVVSRVLRRLLGDVVASHSVRESLNSLPARSRVPTFKEIKSVPPLPDRVTAALAPYLQASTSPTQPPPTAAAAAVNASASSTRNARVRGIGPGVAGGDIGTLADHNYFGVTPRVSGCTPLIKEDLLAALRTAGIRVKPPHSRNTGGNGGAGRQKKDPLAAGLVAAIEACPGPSVTLHAVTAALDKATVVRLEAWLEQKSLQSEAHVPASGASTITTATTCAVPVRASTTNATSTGTAMKAPGSGAIATRARNAMEDDAVLARQAPPPPEMHAHATLIQAQARRVQAVQSTEERARQRLQGLTDKACQDPDTQRMLAAALEGTFFKLIQEAFNGEFKLSKRPTRYVIRKHGPSQAKSGLAA